VLERTRRASAGYQGLTRVTADATRPINIGVLQRFLVIASSPSPPDLLSWSTPCRFRLLLAAVRRAHWRRGGPSSGSRLASKASASADRASPSQAPIMSEPLPGSPTRIEAEIRRRLGEEAWSRNQVTLRTCPACAATPGQGQVHTRSSWSGVRAERVELRVAACRVLRHRQGAPIRGQATRGIHAPT
jgi:hypothetical protein